MNAPFFLVPDRLGHLAPPPILLGFKPAQVDGRYCEAGVIEERADAWGSNTQIRSCGESVLLVYEPTKQVATAHVRGTHRWRDAIFRHR